MPQDGDAVGNGERLLLIMRHIDRGQAERLLQLTDLDAHLGPQLRVEIGQRLVEQENRGLDDERAGDGHALQLAARELMRRARTIAGEAHPLERLVDARLDVG